MSATLTTSEALDLAIAVITGVAVIIAAVSAWIGVVNERKRTQPVVMANEARGRYMSDSAAMHGAWFVDAYLTSEGSGSAFNVRFGVEFHGVRYPHRIHRDDPDGGNVQRILGPNERRPAQGAWPVLLSASGLFGVAEGGGDPDPGRIYWARYENAHGDTWETRNPGDRSARLDIRRVRFVAWRERRERRMRERSAAYSAEFERRALAELIAGFDESTSDDPTNG